MSPQNFLPSHFAVQSMPRHVGIIMDGNRRWAEARGWPRLRGHEAGVGAVRRVVRAARRLGIPALTLYAFSSDNWRRTPAEVAAVLGLLRRYLESEREELASAGVRCLGIGRRDRLPAALLAALAALEHATRDGGRMLLRLALDYSARGAIAQAAAEATGRWAAGLRPSPGLLRSLIESALEADAGPVDLLIRSGGERRLSDFLLWESAYAELIFTRTPWPAFGARELRRALAAFARRQRRFGGDGIAPLSIVPAFGKAAAQ